MFFLCNGLKEASNCNTGKNRFYIGSFPLTEDIVNGKQLMLRRCQRSLIHKTMLM
jgi:hypothetical protein